MSKRILYVEDSRTARAVVASWLTKAGYDVTMGSDGEEGLAKAQSDPPDLVITDVHMPKVDGFELCRNLKQNSPTAHLPVILLTRLNDAPDILRGLDAGADAFVVKGSSPMELLARIERVLNGVAALERRTVETFSKKLLLTHDRADIFKLLFEALAKETELDVLALLVNEGQPKPFVTISRAPLPEPMLRKVADSMLETWREVAGTSLTWDELKVQRLATGPDEVAVSADPSGFINVPILDEGALVGFLGIFSCGSKKGHFNEKLRMFFEIGVEFCGALRRISIAG